MKFIYVLGVLALLGIVLCDESDGGDSSEEDGRCQCERKTCSRVNGTKEIGCPNTNSFLQCTGTDCIVQACPSGQVWSFSKNACSACDADKHIAANLQKCVCNEKTTYDSDTKTCVPCPSAATVEADRCYCPSTMVLDEANNVCKACPAEATLTRRECECTDSTLFFSEATWTCKACPGTLEPPRRENRRSSCRCTGLNEIFKEEDVTCYTCPAGTTANDDNDECDCPRRTGLEFNDKTEKCECKAGYTLGASGVCTKNP